MINISIAGGILVYLLGGMLAAVLLGPWSIVIIITTVLALQAFIFLDGGITVSGANILNMAVIGVLSGYGVYLLFRNLWPNRTGVLVGTFVGLWVSVVMAAIRLFIGTLILRYGGTQHCASCNAHLACNYWVARSCNYNSCCCLLNPGERPDLVHQAAGSR